MNPTLLAILLAFFVLATVGVLAYAYLQHGLNPPSAPEQEQRIEPGQRWMFNVKNIEPWPREPYAPVVILDVKDGWVRYDMGGIFHDERLKIESFLRMYRRCDS